MPRMADGCNMPHAPFVRPDLGSFCRLDELGLQVEGQRLEPGRAVLRRRGCAARQRDPAAGARSARVAPDDVADHDPRWALEGSVCQHLTVARVSEGRGVSWNTAYDAVLAEGRCV